MTTGSGMEWGQTGAMTADVPVKIASKVPYRRRVFVCDKVGFGAAWVGASDVTTANGFPIPAGGGLELFLPANAELWAVSETTNNIVRYTIIQLGDVISYGTAPVS